MRELFVQLIFAVLFCLLLANYRIASQRKFKACGEYLKYMNASKFQWKVRCHEINVGWIYHAAFHGLEKNVDVRTVAAFNVGHFCCSNTIKNYSTKFAHMTFAQ